MCIRCRGTGKITYPPALTPQFPTSQTCPDCAGTGQNKPQER
jgi:DnaJ-class molecular chaperone